MVFQVTNWEEIKMVESITKCLSKFRRELKQEQQKLKESLQREAALYRTVGITQPARLRERLKKVESELAKLETETLY